MNKSLMLLVAGMLAAGSLFADDATGDVSSIPVLPGWGKYFWNRLSTQYIYPPAFDFKEVKGAANYRYRVEDDQEYRHNCYPAKMNSSLIKAARFAGQNVLIHPAQAGEAFVELHRVTKETKYLEAFSIRDYGADTEATPKENAAAIQRAIDAAAAAGGGRVTVPEGKYNIGTIWLKSNVELHLEEDAWLVGSADLADYNADDAYPGNWGCPAEGWSAKHLIIAYDVRNVAVTGPGTIDGNGSAFFRGRPYYGRGNYGWRHGMRHTANRKDSYRPGQELVFVNCRDVRVENVYFQEMACWTCFFYCCDRVRVNGCTIRTQLSYANADGFDVDRCRDVVITGCDIETGDDCLTVRASGAATRPCEDIVFSNCVCRCSASGVRIGVGTGEIRKVRVSDLDMREAGNGIVIQSAYPSKDRKPGTGVTIHDIDFDNIRMRETGLAVLITSGAPDTEAAISDLRFTDIDAETMGAIILDGCAAKPIENVVFNGLRLEVRSRDFPWAKNWQVVTTNCDHEAAIWVDHAKGVRFDRTAVKFAHDRGDTRSKLFSIVNSEEIIK